MSGRDPIVGEGVAQLLRGVDGAPAAPALTGIVIGELVAIAGNGRTPLVLFPGQPGTAALGARTVVDLHGPHIGSQVVLMFDGGNPCMPVIMGVLRGRDGWPLAGQPGQVQADVDGARLIVGAQDELVLRCGKASITLTRDGKVTIRGTHVFSRSSGVNRVKGGSVQLN